MPLTNGATFAGYTIIRPLGSGGMGEVYLAQHPRLPRRDALKLLPREWSADEGYRARLNREADLASTLWHPHIVGVHDRGEVDGQLWISMDFVDGLDAARLLAERYPKGMPVDDVLRIVTAVASALDYAHKQGLLHRDVKPANIMLTHLDDEDEQRILLTDFGIARNIDDISGLTATNMTVGTVAYSAPEQLLGEELDGRTDQYALAATAYHLLTGSHVFPHSNPAVVISRHLNNPPPPLAEAQSELAWLDPAMSRGLAKRPEDRFTRCSDFARALQGDASSTVAADHSTPTAQAPTATNFADKAQTHTGNVAGDAETVATSASQTAKARPRTANSSTSDTKPPADTDTSGFAASQRHHTLGPVKHWLPWIAVVAVLTVIGGVVAWRPWEQNSTHGPIDPPPTSHTPFPTPTATALPPSPSLSPKAIDQVLLTADQLTDVLGTAVSNDPSRGGPSGLALTSSSYGLSDHSNQVTPPACAGVVFTGDRDSYAGEEPVAVKTQTFGAPFPINGGRPHLLDQTARVFSSYEAAQQFRGSARGKWTACASDKVYAHFGYESGAGFILSNVASEDALITVGMASTTNVGPTNGADACQQAMGVRENVVVEVRSCEAPNLSVPPNAPDLTWVIPDAARVAMQMLTHINP
ncbi:serine/threonine-protein kinase PknH/PknJ [Mycobacterium kansasii]|uniref:serine/threonine-protein kinase PknH/PknJ n=1 Tax=Mycobacterium kansasii TaxID=1768 RepID=UPI001CE26860|nr:sensor domain-containing protein [Mycobacterium kansasii]UCA22917.1 serine/threonine-protein kinase PknH/PknJ [Mycobacterium kansasii]